MFDKKKLDQWIRRQLVTKDGRIQGISILHIDHSSNETVLDDIESENIKVTDEHVAGIMQLAKDDAETYTSSVGGVQTFAVKVFVKDSDPVYFRFRHGSGSLGGPEDVGDSEPPNGRGVTSMVMRHMEARERGTWAMLGQVMQIQNSMLERLAAQNERLYEDKMKSIEVIETMKTQQEERQAIRTTAEAKAKMMTDGFEKVTALLPMALQAFVAKKGGSTAPTYNAMMDTFLDSLSEEEFELLMNNPKMKTEQKALLLNMVKDRAKRLKSKQKQLPAKKDDSTSEDL